MKNHCFFNDPEVIRGTEGGDAIEKQFYWKFAQSPFLRTNEVKAGFRKAFRVKKL